MGYTALIAICEPQCYGFEHVETNSAFIAAVMLAFPNERVLFLAEEGHLKLVRDKLSRNSVGKLEYNAVKIP